MVGPILYNKEKIHFNAEQSLLHDRAPLAPYWSITSQRKIFQIFLFTDFGLNNSDTSNNQDGQGVYKEGQIWGVLHTQLLSDIKLCNFKINTWLLWLWRWTIWGMFGCPTEYHCRCPYTATPPPPTPCCRCSGSRPTSCQTEVPIHANIYFLANLLLLISGTICLVATIRILSQWRYSNILGNKCPMVGFSCVGLERLFKCLDELKKVISRVDNIESCHFQSKSRNLINYIITFTWFFAFQNLNVSLPVNVGVSLIHIDSLKEVHKISPSPSSLSWLSSSLSPLS